MDRARRQHSHIPLPSEKTMEKQNQNQVDPRMLSSVGHPSTAGGNRAHHSGSFSEASLEKQTRVLCLPWLYQSGESSKRASELGNTNNGEWDVQDVRGHPLRGLVSGKQLRQSMENSRVLLQGHPPVITSDGFTPKPLPSPVTLF